MEYTRLLELIEALETLKDTGIVDRLAIRSALKKRYACTDAEIDYLFTEVYR